jgi:hypothetical protein
MPTVYRKSLKGMDELTSTSSALPLRLRSYLLAVDGLSSTEELAAKNPHLPSMDVILDGLMQQGFVDLIAAPSASAKPVVPAAAGGAAYRVSPPSVAAPARAAPELESAKASMVRDVSSLLGTDAEPVIKKIQNCQTRDDLFAAMMGIKKIITLYVDKQAGDRFAAKYDVLSS